MKNIRIFIPVIACLALCFFIFGCGNATGGGGGGGGAAYRLTFSVSTESPTDETFGEILTDPSTEGNVHTSGTYVELTAMSLNPNYMFSSWEGSISGETSPVQVRVDGNMDILARFKIKPSDTYALDITVSPDAGCGTVAQSGTSPYDAGTVVVLTAEANPRSSFDHWSGALSRSKNPTTITMNEAKDVTAVFKGFYVNIDIDRGTVRFPNKYSGWHIAGGQPGTCYIAYPSGWILGGAAGTNWVAIPPKPGWIVGGAALTNYVPIPNGWSMGGNALTNYTPLPPGWTVGGTSLTNYFPLPPGWTVGGAAYTNWVALAPGWSVGGASETNYVAVPPGWSVGGAALTNYVALAPGWTFGGAALTNYVGLPPGWHLGGTALADYVALPPGWTTKGDSSDWIPCPTNSVSVLEFAFADPSFLGMCKVLQDDGTMTDDDLADYIVSAYWSMNLWYWYWW